MLPVHAIDMRLLCQTKSKEKGFFEDVPHMAAIMYIPPKGSRVFSSYS